MYFTVASWLWMLYKRADAKRSGASLIAGCPAILYELPKSKHENSRSNHERKSSTQINRVYRSAFLRGVLLNRQTLARADRTGLLAGITDAINRRVATYARAMARHGSTSHGDRIERLRVLRAERRKEAHEHHARQE